MPKSQNGYSANDQSIVKSYQIPGTTRYIRLRADDCGFVLVDFFAWFHRTIEPIDIDQLDDWGYAERPVRGEDEDGDLSNHASGTAGDLNAVKHPLGRRGTFTPAQTAKIRAKIATYDGVIRWGGDYVKRADEMHFEINKPYADVQRVANRIRKEWFGMDKDEFIKVLDERLEKAIWKKRIPVTPGSKAEKAYGKDAKLTLPNALYWLAAEGVDDVDLADLKVISTKLDLIVEELDQK